MLSVISQINPINPVAGLFTKKNPPMQDQSLALEMSEKIPMLTLEQMQKIAGQLNESVKSNKFDLSFTVDDSTNKIVIRVIDGNTKEVIRQIPPEEVLRIASQVNQLLGILIDELL